MATDHVEIPVLKFGNCHEIFVVYFMRTDSTAKALLHYALFHWRFFIFPRVFLFSLRLSLGFCYQHVGIKNARKNVRKREKIGQHEKSFLYYTMLWVKTRVSCVFSRVLERLRSPKCKPNALCNMGLKVLYYMVFLKLF